MGAPQGAVCCVSWGPLEALIVLWGTLGTSRSLHSRSGERLPGAARPAPAQRAPVRASTTSPAPCSLALRPPSSDSHSVAFRRSIKRAPLHWRAPLRLLVLLRYLAPLCYLASLHLVATLVFLASLDFLSLLG